MSRRTQGARPAYRWAVWFLVSVGVWNFLAAGVFGFLIKLPVALTLEAWKIGALEHSATKGPMLGRTASRDIWAIKISSLNTQFLTILVLVELSNSALNYLLRGSVIRRRIGENLFGYQGPPAAPWYASEAGSLFPLLGKFSGPIWRSWENIFRCTVDFPVRRKIVGN
jgi:hypothetical protein